MYRESMGRYKEKGWMLNLDCYDHSQAHALQMSKGPCEKMANMAVTTKKKMSTSCIASRFMGKLNIKNELFHVHFTVPLFSPWEHPTLTEVIIIKYAVAHANQW